MESGELYVKYSIQLSSIYYRDSRRQNHLQANSNFGSVFFSP